MIQEYNARLAHGETLSEGDACRAISAMVEGTEDPDQMGVFLTALRERGETADELVGAARSLRQHAVSTGMASLPGLADTCGTGGAAAPSFNVSTAAAIVASACGVPVAKHGNRSFSSKTGSADAFTALGVNLEAPTDVVDRTLREIGLAFFFAPLWHPAMKHVAPVRRTLKFRTLFNLVGPLANPAPVEYQLLGVGERKWMEPMAESLGRLGSKGAAVVCSADGHDEVSLSAETHVFHVTKAGTERLTWTAHDFGMKEIASESLQADGPEESAAMIRDVLAGKEGPAADVVVANVAALLWVVNKASNLRDGAQLAREAISSGEAQAQLDRLVLRTNHAGLGGGG